MCSFSWSDYAQLFLCRILPSEAVSRAFVPELASPPSLRLVAAGRGRVVWRKEYNSQLSFQLNLVIQAAELSDLHSEALID
jgi:hypothetical protein